MKKRVFTLFVIASLLIISLTSCIADVDIRPQGDAGEIWVCEEPYLYFRYDEVASLFPGILIINDQMYEVCMESSSGKRIGFVDPGAYDMENDTVNEEGHLIFDGMAEFYEGYFDLTLREDPHDLFGEDVETIKFVRYTPEEFEAKFSHIFAMNE